jgi:hypothetical protein
LRVRGGALQAEPIISGVLRLKALGEYMGAKIDEFVRSLPARHSRPRLRGDKLRRRESRSN